MTEREPSRVKRLARKRDRPQQVGSEHIALLANERVTAQAGLQSNLVALARAQPDFDERCGLERLDDTVVADGVLPARVARMSLFLNQRFRIPDESIPPGSSRGIRMSVHHGQIDSLGLSALELPSQLLLSSRVFGEYDQP